jgi:hypothetical protein
VGVGAAALVELLGLLVAQLGPSTSMRVARSPALVRDRRPLVITVEPTAGLDATVTMPPPTFGFLSVAVALLFAR